MGIARDLGPRSARPMLGTGTPLPAMGTLFVSVANRDKRAIVFPVKRLADLGFRVIATRGTAALLARARVPVSQVRKVSEGGPNIVDLIAQGEVDLIGNTPFGREPRGDGSAIRTAASAAEHPGRQRCPTPPSHIDDFGGEPMTF